MSGAFCEDAEREGGCLANKERTDRLAAEARLKELEAEVTRIATDRARIEIADSKAWNEERVARREAEARVGELEKILSSPETVERLAAFAHKSWSGWTAWMISKWGEKRSTGESYRDGWERQMQTDYANLSEAEKESDRVEARGMLEALRGREGK